MTDATPINDPNESAPDDLLGARLIRLGKVTASDIDRALAYQAQSTRNANNRIGGVLLRMGALSEESLLTALAEQNGMAFVHPYDDPDVIAGQGTVAMEILPHHRCHHAA